MYTISKNIENEIIINKSRFICICIKVYNENEALNHIEDIKKKYKDATHYCYSYIIDNTKRFNDDGEPGGTAGIPILNILETNNLNYILCVVIRYFGGIKLGAGGLVRAYSKSASECLKKDKFKKLVDGLFIKITFSYDKSKIIDNVLKDIDIINKEFYENIVYTFNIENNEFEIIKEILISNCLEINTSNNIIIEK